MLFALERPGSKKRGGAKAARKLTFVRWGRKRGPRAAGCGTEAGWCSEEPEFVLAVADEEVLCLLVVVEH
ncbi:hypothetical protein, partial [Thauera linaloolentis]|uniref:hypothetical protein n=1 Tax=Thauera linaloolentis TaxID=76112 RepID=UPI001B7FB418